jgi:hypothetical protein
LFGDTLLLRVFERYGIVFKNECYSNRCHGDAVRDFGPSGIIFMNVLRFHNSCHGNAVREFGPYSITFMNTCVITISVLLKEFEPYRITFTTV